MSAQSVILPLPSDHARFIVLRLKDLTISELKEQLESIAKNDNRSLNNLMVKILSDFARNTQNNKTAE